MREIATVAAHPSHAKSENHLGSNAGRQLRKLHLTALIQLYLKVLIFSLLRFQKPSRCLSVLA
jgi:hypothetical protein